MPSTLTARSAVTPDFVRARYHYDPSTGKVFRRLPTGELRRVGHRTKDGYYATRIHHKQFFLHRLAWVLVTGDWPADEIDHVNGDRLDNRLCNLRDVSRRINLENQRNGRRKNAAGFLGVHQAGTRWRAQIGVHGRTIRLGYFDSAEQAAAAYLDAKRRLHAGCAI